MTTRPVPAWADRLPFYYGWVVIAIAFITMAIGVNARTAFSLLYPPILEEFGWSRGVTAAAFSLGFFASAAYAPLIGTMMDRWGPRFVISVSAVSVAVGLALTTVIAEPWQLYATLGVLVVGGSLGMAYTGHGSFVPRWFERKRGLAVGIAFSGVGLGAMAMFPWMQALIDGGGWRTACWSVALLVLVVVLPLNMLFQRQDPAELGLRPDGDVAPAPAPAGQAPAVPANVVDRAWVATEWTLARAMRTARFWWLAGGFISGMFTWYLVMVHQTQFLIDIGVSRERAAMALGVVPLFGVIGQIGFGHLSDRIGREWGWTIGCLGFVICYGTLLLMKSHTGMPLLALMVISQGVLGYAMTPNYGSIPAEIFQGSHYGSIFGWLSVSTAVGASAGPWIGGVIYDETGSYDMAFALGLVAAVLSSACIWMASPRKVRSVAGRIGRG
ncbi:MAG: MFS transporter [Burkholderiaceae bacterium]